jgi:hypothetical protein
MRWRMREISDESMAKAFEITDITVVCDSYNPGCSYATFKLNDETEKYDFNKCDRGITLNWNGIIKYDEADPMECPYFPDWMIETAEFIEENRKE